MPKINPLRSLANERNVAERIKFEREKREWTYEGLASRMTHAGNPMQASAIYKIEKADPPRRITVDELVGFSRVFNLDPSDMLLPMSRVHDAEAMKLIEQIDSDLKVLWSTIHSLVQDHIATWRLAASDRDTDREVLERVRQWMPSGSVFYPMGPDNHPRNKTVTPDPINKAVHGLFDAFIEYARWRVNSERR